MPKAHKLQITRANQNNLKDLSLEIPHRQLIAVVGVSGSGKSSLAFEVIANEGRRQYLETIPSFARQFAGKSTKPIVDKIEGLFPVVTVGQFTRAASSSSTVGTTTEIYSLLRLAFARFGSIPSLTRSHFSFNSKLGACPHCNGLGLEERISLEKLVVHPDKTLREGALAPTLPNGYIMYSQVTVDVLNTVCEQHGFNVDIPWNQLTTEQQDVVLNGSDRIKVPFGKHSIESRLKWTGLKAKPREEGYYKGMLPIMRDILRRDRNKNILKYVESIPCTSCNGKRLHKKTLESVWLEKDIDSFVRLSLVQLCDFLVSAHSVSEAENKVIQRMRDRLQVLIGFGLGSLRLADSAVTLSPGQIQKIRIAHQLTADLTNVLYVFDEPAIGMNDAQKLTLLNHLNTLVSKGNTVIVVEHDLQLIRMADWVIEIGPEAGINGGELLYNGPISNYLKGAKTPTQQAILDPNPDLAIDFEVVPFSDSIGQVDSDIYIDQNPIGRTPRSNPATYTGLADHIRDLMAKQPLARERDYKKGRFSFNNKGGRCETCEGAGKIQVGMHYMGKVDLPCETCGGKRFNEETLEVQYNGKSMSDIYELSIDEASRLFQDQPKMMKIFARLTDLGLGYLQLGQSSTTLSGGEAQRIKLATWLSKSTKGRYILEEPTNALHHKNVLELIETLNNITKEGKEVICISNHPLLLQKKSKKLTNQLNTNSHHPKHSTIALSGVSTNNLKNIDAGFPKNQITVVTGPSGSGKSSLVFDTLFGEANARFSASLSTYTRSFIQQSNPAVADHFEGLTPTVAINRKNLPNSPRSTVGTLTGIQEKLRFLFSRHTEMSASEFSFNSTKGMCLSCSGIGQKLKAQRKLLAPDWSLSISEGAFTHNSAIRYYGNPDGQFVALLKAASTTDLTSRPLDQLTIEELDLVFDGTGDQEWSTTWHFKNKSREGQQQVSGLWKGFSGFINEEYTKVQSNKKIEAIKALMDFEQCETCNGERLNEKARSVRIKGINLPELGEYSIHELEQWFMNGEFQKPAIIDRIYMEIKPLIRTIKELGLGHLSLNRKSSTLSGGEGQRLRLAQMLTSSLSGMTYVLDEPTIGLHPKNVQNLWSVLRRLKDRNNTLVIVEHNPFVIQKADHRIELGPGSEKNGGEIIQAPSKSAVQIEIPRVNSKEFLHIKEVHRYSLKNRDFKFQLNAFTVITGLSGSGKSTLMNEVIAPSIREGVPTHCKSIDFPFDFAQIIQVDQRTLNSSGNTTVASYTGVLDNLAQAFAKSSTSKELGLKKTHFLYHHKNGRCEHCGGYGRIKVALDLMEDVWNHCNSCNGERYNAQSLQIRLEGLHLGEWLQLTMNEVQNFTNKGTISSSSSIVNLLSDLGLGHLQLGQNVSSLSGGEAQRLKLAHSLHQLSNERTLILLDEPSAGLNSSDIERLLKLFYHYINLGHTILCVEHDELIVQHAQYEVEV